MYDEIAAELCACEEALFAAQAQARAQRSPESRQALRQAEARLERVKAEAHRLLFG